MIKSLLFVIFVVVLFVFGGIALIYPERVRDAHLRRKITWNWQTIRLVSPRQWVWSIRVSGVIGILMALFFCWAQWINR
jgi:hypothetical protein